MPIYVILAYAIFCAVPLVMGIAYGVRYRRLMREIEVQQVATMVPGVLQDGDTYSTSERR